MRSDALVMAILSPMPGARCRNAIMEHGGVASPAIETNHANKCPPQPRWTQCSGVVTWNHVAKVDNPEAVPLCMHRHSDTRAMNAMTIAWGGVQN